MRKTMIMLVGGAAIFAGIVWAIVELAKGFGAIAVRIKGE